MIIVDTSVWIDYLANVENEQTLVLEAEMSRKRLGMTDLILSEILQGVRDDKAVQQVQELLSQYAIFDTGGKQMATASAQNYRFLRSRGHTIRGIVDCFVATFCLQENHILLHRDRDYRPFEQHLGLQVLNPYLH